MNLVRKKKLQKLLSISLVISIVMGLVLYALRQNISLFYTPSEIAQGKAPLGHAIRAGGVVVPHSIQHPKTSQEVIFKITDFKHTIQVRYRGILPDLFREGQGVVVQGRLKNLSAMKATTVLAKHDENYKPPELKNMDFDRHFNQPTLRGLSAESGSREQVAGRRGQSGDLGQNMAMK